MGYLTVTNTFVNGAASDATAVNQNFTDVINATSDGTKNFNISALTVAGACVLNAAVTLGDSSVDDITVTGSLASSIPIKTTFSYDIGAATIGLRDLYFGDAGSAARTTKIRGATVASSWTLTLPTTGGTDGYFLQTNGSGVSSWQPTYDNLALTASVSANALTIAMKTLAGTDPSATDPIYITVRSATATSGTPVRRKVTAATSIVVPNTATLGHAAAMDQYVWVYAVDNAGTIELGVTGVDVKDDTKVITTTAVDTASDLGTVMYSNSVRTAVGHKLIGRVTIQEATPGVWATSPTYVAVNVVPTKTTTPLVTYTLTIGAVTTPPTLGTNSSLATWRRDGEFMEIHYSLYESVNASVTGTGVYLFPIPATYTIDTTKVNVTTNGSGGGGTVLGASHTALTAAAVTNYAAPGFVVAYNTTNLAICAVYIAAGQSVLVGSTGYNLGTAPVYYSFSARVPIVGWSTFGP